MRGGCSNSGTGDSEARSTVAMVLKDKSRRDKVGSGRGHSLKSPSHEAVSSTLRFHGSKLIANEHLIQLGLASH